VSEEVGLTTYLSPIIFNSHLLKRMRRIEMKKMKIACNVDFPYPHIIKRIDGMWRMVVPSI